jgi:hypothetical protein
MIKLSLLAKGHRFGTRVIGNAAAGDPIYGRRSLTTRAELIGSGNLVNLIKVFFLSALSLALGLPHQCTLATPVIMGLGRRITLAFRKRQMRPSKNEVA